MYTAIQARAIVFFFFVVALDHSPFTSSCKQKTLCPDNRRSLRLYPSLELVAPRSGIRSVGFITDSPVHPRIQTTGARQFIGSVFTDVSKSGCLTIPTCAQSEKSKPLKCGTFGASSYHQRAIATGDFDGRLHIWDIADAELPVYSVKAHDQIINAIDGVGGLEIGSGAPEIATASRDGSVKVWDPRQKDDPVAIMEPHDGETHRDCWTVALGNAFNNEERCVCAGYDNGDIKMFDLRNMALRWETNIKNGVCCVEFDRKDICMNKLVATSLEGKFYVYDLRTQHPKKGFASLTEKAHKSTVWTARHLPQNREIFMTTGGNGSLCLWKYNYPESRSKDDGEGNMSGVVGTVTQLQNVLFSTQPISALDWSPDKQGLAVATSFDQNIRVVLVTKLNRNI